MNHSDIAALMKGAAPVIHDLVVALVEPLVKRIGELEQQIADRDDADMVRALVADAVAALPPAPAGKDGAPGERGAPGKDGKMPIVKAWSDAVHYAGEIVTHDGATYQALCDTGRQPPHEDWACLAARGGNGADGRSFTVRGTWSPDNTYEQFDVVVLNGASFVARKDDPGACPGDGWQLSASQGKRGQPGEPGGRGVKGDAGPRVESIQIDDQGLLTLTNADGSTVTCDLYPVLSKVA